MELAKADTLDIIYTDNTNYKTEQIMTRSKTQQKRDLDKAQELVLLHSDSDQMDDIEEYEYNQKSHIQLQENKPINDSLYTILEEET